MEYSLLNLYITVILVIKAIFLFRILQLSYFRFFKPKDKKMIAYVTEKKEQVANA
mgnify:FL=1